MMKTFTVNVEWDDETQVYVATSEDVPGLVTEASTLDAVKDKVLALVPILLEENAHLLPAGHEDGIGDLVRLCVESSFSLESARAH